MSSDVLSVVKFIHVLAVIYFVGPGLFMMIALSPAMRRAAPEDLGPAMKLLRPVFSLWRKIIGMYLMPVIYVAGFVMIWRWYAFQAMRWHAVAAVLMLIPYFWMSALMNRSESLKKQGDIQAAAPLDKRINSLSILLFITGWVIVFFAVMKF